MRPDAFPRRRACPIGPHTYGPDAHPARLSALLLFLVRTFNLPL